MITVPTKMILDMLPNAPCDKEYAIVKEESKLYQYNGSEKQWNPVEISGDGIKLTLYDINKSIFEQLEPMSDESLRQVHSQVYKFLGDTMKDEKNDYWALICWNKSYITIFHHMPEGQEEISDVFMDIIESLGEVKDVSDNGHGALEIWITDKSHGEPTTDCYLFFNYKDGVVEGIA